MHDKFIKVVSMPYKKYKRSVIRGIGEEILMGLLFTNQEAKFFMPTPNILSTLYQDILIKKGEHTYRVE